MAKTIPKDFIQTTLDRIDIVEVIGQHVKLSKKGANHLGCCPFHHEKTPSFSVSQSKQFYYCFGCGKNGNAIGFLMDHQRLSFVETIEELAHMAGLDVPYEHIQKHSAHTTDPNTPDRKRALSLMELAKQFYMTQLKTHEKKALAIDYLKNRGIDGKTALLFQLGYSPPNWHDLHQHLESKGYRRDEILACGLAVKNDNGQFYDRFRGRLMFPIINHREQCVGFGARALSDQDQPKYLNSPESFLFNKGQMLYAYQHVKHNHEQPVLIVEGYMDVISLAQHHIHQAVATLGTATTENHLNFLFRYHRSLIFCFDGDRAGLKAAWRALQLAIGHLNEDRSIKFLLMPPGEDPDSLVKKQGTDDFNARIEQAIPLGEFLFNTLSEKFNLDTLDGRAQMIAKMMPYLNRTPKGPYQSLMIEKLAKLCDTGTRQIKAQMKQQHTPKKPTGQYNTYTPKDKFDLIDKTIMILIKYPQLTPATLINWPSNTPKMETLKALVACLNAHPSMHTGQILEHFRSKPDQSYLAQLASTELPHASLEILKKELNESWTKMHRQALFEELNSLIEKAKQHELNPNEKSRLTELLQQTK